MISVRNILLVTLTVGALCGAQACASETVELNPQPLPPGGEPANGKEEPEAAGNDQGSSGGLGSGGSAAPGADAGSAGGDASDASDGGAG